MANGCMFIVIYLILMVKQNHIFVTVSPNVFQDWEKKYLHENYSKSLEEGAVNEQVSYPTHYSTPPQQPTTITPFIQYASDLK